MGASKHRIMDEMYLPEPPEYRPPIPLRTRVAVRRRADCTCEDCANPVVRLTFHHLHYRTLGEESPDDLALLCWDCHKQRHRCPYTGEFFVHPEDRDEQVEYVQHMMR